MIKEYRTSSLALVDVMQADWDDAVISLDLRYVAAAEPFDGRNYDHRYTQVVLSGGRQVVINEEYSRFIRDWHSVKR